MYIDIKSIKPNYEDSVYDGSYLHKGKYLYTEIDVHVFGDDYWVFDGTFISKEMIGSIDVAKRVIYEKFVRA